MSLLLFVLQPTEHVKQQVAKKFAPLFQLTPGNPITLNQTICCTLDLVERTGRISAGEELTFQKTFSLPEPVAAHIVASTDNGGDIFLNGEKVTSCKDWMYPVSEPVKVPFNEGTNTIQVALKNIGGLPF